MHQLVAIIKKINKSKFQTLWLALLVLVSILSFQCKTDKSGNKSAKAAKSIYARENLVAWCIVPYDVKERSPEERAQMLHKLGITKLAYDWREKHISTFDAELEALKKHNIQLQAFWYMSGPEPEKDKNLKIILDVLQRQRVKTQIWCMLTNIKGLDTLTQEQKIAAHAKPLRYIAEKAAEIGCSVGLYNHGGWYGMPENQVQIIDYLKMPNLGIVYNFHHAEDDVARFPKFLPLIKPHLMAVTLMGLVKGPRAKVVPIGHGNAEQEMMQLLKESGYKGPISIINEDTAPDAEAGLQINLHGLQKILQAMNDTEALKTYR